MDPWVVEVLRVGYRIPFLSRPPLSAVPIPMPSYNPLSTKGVALGEVTQALIAKGAVELASLPSPGFYSRLFVVWKTSGSWRQVIDLSTLNRFVDVSHFRMETIQSVRPSGGLDGLHRSQGGLPTGSHPSGISPVPPFCGTWLYLSVHSTVLWPLHGPAGFLPGHGSCFRNPPFLGYSHASIPRRLASPVVLLRVSPPGPPGGPEPLSGAGIVINPEKSNLEPSQVVQYFGVVIDARTLWLLHRQNASPGFYQQQANFYPPPILPPVSGSRC